MKGNNISREPSSSADGTKVAFKSFASNLDPGDRESDIYVKELGAPPPGECTITGTPGDDFLPGTRGDDVICGLGGKDTIQGRAGNDILIGGDGADILIGGDGDDTLQGQARPDRLRAVDEVSSNDTADGGDGFDRCRADPGDTLVSCP